MHELEIKRHMGRADIEAVSELLRVAEAADGHHPIDEHQWLDLVEGGRPGFAGLVAWMAGHDHPVGYAQVSRGDHSWSLEFVVDPHHRSPGEPIGHDLVGAALGVIGVEGGGRVHLWVNKPTTLHDRIATTHRLHRARDLYQMRRTLPTEERPSLAVRTFVVGQDEEAWLAVNNRAFAAHPEQGGWDLDTIKARQRESWFDPAGFLLFEEGGGLGGFCWTKIHDDHDPPLGEIYVIATDPDFQGRGLGRQLVLAGLDHLAAKGLDTGMLYVDAGNVPAVKLYVDMGFTVDHIDRVYVGDVAAP